jgi:hypothetical protein
MENEIGKAEKSWVPKWDWEIADYNKRSGSATRSWLDIPQCGTITLWSFIASGPFTPRLHQFAGDEAGEIWSVLQTNRGAMVRGLGGIRKARGANPGRGKGKSRGYRYLYLYLYLEPKRRVHLLFLLDKNEQEHATEEQRGVFREMVARIKGESGG